MVGSFEVAGLSGLKYCRSQGVVLGRFFLIFSPVACHKTSYEVEVSIADE